MEQLESILWQIINAFTWAFHAEERMALQFDTWGLSNEIQIPIIIGFNALLIAAEIMLFSGILKKLGFDTKKPKTPRFVLWVTRGKAIGLPELAILAFVPWGQKFGSFIYATQRKYFGLKGYIALCCGGALRLTGMIYLPKQAIWIMIAGMVLIRILSFISENGYHLPPSKRKNNGTK